MRRLLLALSLLLLATATAAAQPLSSRIRATGALDVCVATAGADLPTRGLSYGTNGDGCFATPGYAVWWASVNLDMAGYRLRVLVNAGAYGSNGAPGTCAVTSATPNGACFGVYLYDILGSNALWGSHPLILQGAANNVPVVDPCDGPLLSFTALQGITGIATQSVWELNGLQVQSTIVGVNADRGTRINLGSYSADACSSPYPTPIKFQAIYGGSIEFIGNVRVNGNGNWLINALFQGGIIQVNDTAIAFYNNPWFAWGLTNVPDASTYYNRAALVLVGAYH